MFKKVFLYHWIDWTIAGLIILFLLVWWQAELFAIEQQEYSIEAELRPQLPQK